LSVTAATSHRLRIPCRIEPLFTAPRKLHRQIPDHRAKVAWATSCPDDQQL
jgi:hypothetical protein